MKPPETFLHLLHGPMPVLALAPMQDVTTLEFWRVLARYGGADAYWTEYFRVHGNSRPDKWILRSIAENPTGQPVVAQNSRQLPRSLEGGDGGGDVAA